MHGLAGMANMDLHGLAGMANTDLHGLGIDEGIQEGSGAPSSHSRAMTTGPSGEAHVGMMLSEF